MEIDAANMARRSAPLAPFKTPLGHDEIRSRSARLSQRMRTVLLLVDGRRTFDELRELAQRVGASERCLDDLLNLGLIGMPQIEVAAEEPTEEAPATTRSSLVDSMMSTFFPAFESTFGGLPKDAALEPRDPELEAVRRTLMREVRSRAPVAGAMTLLKLRGAGTREELLALLDEVASHISQPMRHLSALQILTNARTALERPH